MPYMYQEVSPSQWKGEMLTPTLSKCVKIQGFNTNCCVSTAWNESLLFKSNSCESLSSGDIPSCLQNRIRLSKFCHRLLKDIACGYFVATCRGRGLRSAAGQSLVKTMFFIASFVLSLQARSVTPTHGCWPRTWNINPTPGSCSSLSVFLLSPFALGQSLLRVLLKSKPSSQHPTPARDFCWPCSCLPAPPCHNIWFPLIHSQSFVSP